MTIFPHELSILFFRYTHMVLEPLPCGGTTTNCLTGPNFLAFALLQRHRHSRLKRTKLKFESERKLDQTRFCNHIFFYKISFVCENMGSDQICAHTSFSRKPLEKMVNINKIQKHYDLQILNFCNNDV
jgi:hypothetical protein